jgi:hypothetical protein
LFFSPIFNVADASITSGVLSILLFQRRFFKDGFMEDKPEPHAEIVAEIDQLAENETFIQTEIAPESTDETTTDQSAEAAKDRDNEPNRPLL